MLPRFWAFLGKFLKPGETWEKNGSVLNWFQTFFIFHNIWDNPPH
jgi:hypothetical protein